VFAYGPYQRGIHSMARLATRDRRGFAIFMGVIFVVPALLMVI
jgi:hypothetical protein